MPSSSPSDEQIRELVNELGPAVHDFLVRLLRNRQRAGEVLTRALATEARGRRGKDDLSPLVRVLRTAIQHALPPMEAAGRPRHVDEALARAELTLVDPGRLADGMPAEVAVAAAAHVWEAAASLEPRSFAILDLATRQDLSDEELATVLGIGAAEANALATHTRREAHEAFATHQTIRHCARHCAELRSAVLALPAAAPASELRSAVGPHVRDCPTCTPVRDALPSPIAIYAALAPVSMPPSLVPATVAATELNRSSASQQIARRRTWVIGAAAAATLVAVAVGAAGSLGGPDRQERGDIVPVVLPETSPSAAPADEATAPAPLPRQDRSAEPTDGPVPTPSEDPPTTDAPSADPSDDATAEPSPSPTPTTSTPPPGPSPTPSPSPRPSPSPTPAPAPSPSPSPSPADDTTAPTVQLIAPHEGRSFEADQQDDLGWYAPVRLEATGSDDRDGTLSWRWTSDAQSGTLLNQSLGATRLYAPSCGANVHTLTATAIDDADNRGSDRSTVTVHRTCETN